MPPPRLRPMFGFTPGLARKGRPPLRAGRPFLDLPEKFGEGGKPRRDGPGPEAGRQLAGVVGAGAGIREEPGGGVFSQESVFGERK